MRRIKMSSGFTTLIAAGLMAAVPSAYAASGLMKACKGDLKKAGCDAKTDAEVHECLEKHEEKDKKNDGFSASCYKAHESYEKKNGKMEKGESEHHEESTEKTQ